MVSFRAVGCCALVKDMSSAPTEGVWEHLWYRWCGARHLTALYTPLPFFQNLSAHPLISRRLSCPTPTAGYLLCPFVILTSMLLA